MRRRAPGAARPLQRRNHRGTGSHEPARRSRIRARPLARFDRRRQIYGPPPNLQGFPSQHVYSIPGVINNGLAAAFSCTNVTSPARIVGVEVFDPNGTALNDPSITSVVLQPGATAAFVTQGSNPGFPNATSLALGLIYQGPARILASASSGIICNAFLLDPATTPPITMTNLTIEKHVPPMVASVCGLGAELAFVLPPLMWLTARRRTA